MIDKVTADSDEQFTSEPIPLEANESLIVEYGSWGGAGTPMPVGIDTDGSGQITERPRRGRLTRLAGDGVPTRRHASVPRSRHMTEEQEQEQIVGRDLSIQQRFLPDMSCFGCGPANSRGLQLRSLPGRRR